MKVPRFRIAWMMVFVGIAALDFAAIRALLEFDSRTSIALLAGMLPMANVLAGGILIGRQHPGYRPFLRGFVPFGAMALTLCVVLIFLHDAAALDDYRGLLSESRDMIVRYAPSFDTDLPRAFVIVAWVGWPQLLFALIGGFLSRRFKITSTSY